MIRQREEDSAIAPSRETLSCPAVPKPSRALPWSSLSGILTKVSVRHARPRIGATGRCWIADSRLAAEAGPPSRTRSRNRDGVLHFRGDEPRSHRPCRRARGLTGSGELASDHLQLDTVSRCSRVHLARASRGLQALPDRDDPAFRDRLHRLHAGTGSASMLLCRAFQGFAGAGLYVWWRAAIYVLLPKSERSPSMMRVSCMLFLSSAAGLLLGGTLTDLFGWRLIFLPAIPYAAGALWLLSRHFPALAPQPSDRSVGTDWPGSRCLPSRSYRYR